VAAREAYAAKGYAVDYRNVKKSAGDLEQMLVHSRKRRDVPVIVEDGTVTIGYGGT
jgi:glutaredoxin